MPIPMSSGVGSSTCCRRRFHYFGAELGTVLDDIGCLIEELRSSMGRDGGGELSSLAGGEGQFLDGGGFFLHFVLCIVSRGIGDR